MLHLRNAQRATTACARRAFFAPGCQVRLSLLQGAAGAARGVPGGKEASKPTQEVKACAHTLADQVVL